MKATSARRRARHGGGVKYRGELGSPVVRSRRDYEGDEPAFVCDLCGARVRVDRPAHRVGGGGMPKPWNRCGVELDIASNPDAALPTLLRDEANARQLVTREQVANRFGVSVGTLSTRLLPRPAGNLAGTGRYLYSAREVEARMQELKPRWFTTIPTGRRSA